jgi:ElaB/YqjD/DUF883 family membrane-anchored ribosome-binding protein
MSFDWSFGKSSASDAGERLLEASRGFGDALRDATTRVSHGASTGADYARSLGEDAYAESIRAARSTRKLIEQRPLEAVLIVGLASFAIGWVLRRLQEPAIPARRVTAARASRPARRRTQ